MPEDKVEIEQDVETAKAEEQAVKEQVAEEQAVKEPAVEEEAVEKGTVKKPKAVKAATSKPSATVDAKEKKAAAIDDIMTTIKNMTVLELSQLVKTLEAEFGVSATAPVVAATAAAAALTGAAAPSAEEKTEFNVILKDVGANKISVIRAVRELTTLGLKECKDLVESAPKAVKEGVNKDEATAAKQKLEAAGATAEIT